MTIIPVHTAPIAEAHSISELPILILFPHSRCNCRCVMCDIWRSTTRDQIAPEDVARWLNEWQGLGVQRVVLSGGEALMHGRLWELAHHLRDAGIGITVLSTGLLLARHAAELVRYCDDVVVSLDGPQLVHDTIRNIPRAFTRLAEGVAAVRAAVGTRSEAPPRAPYAAATGGGVAISGRCTVQRANFQHLRATVEAARQIGLDRISFLAADVSSEAFNRPGGWEDARAQGVALAPEDLPLLAAELAALEQAHAADFASGFIAESPLKLRRRLLQYFAAINGQGEFYPNNCNAPWVSSVVEADGTVRPCFFQPPLGNIYRDGGLEAILNAPDAVRFRQGLDPQRDEICRRCVCTLNLRKDAA